MNKAILILESFLKTKNEQSRFALPKTAWLVTSVLFYFAQLKT
jgi:hypothetical protein